MSGLRWLSRLFALVGGVPLLCVFTYVPLSVCLVMLAVPQLPGSARGPAAAWAAGTLPGDAQWSGPSPAEIPDGGYAGPESFNCLLPPVQGYLTDPYGTLRSGGFVHRGIDYGTYYKPVDVRTPFGGMVVFSGWGGSYGSLVVVENAGYRLYLGHHSELFVAPGQVVTAGDLVGRSGDTGNASGIHVHMEVRVWDGARWVPADPGAIRLPGQQTDCSWEALAQPETP